MIVFDHPLETRYDRHRLIPWWDQEKLARASILVAGAGALGNEALKLLALLGIGRILVIDFDVVSRSNLARSVLFRDEDVGRPKVEVAVERVHQINPTVEISGVQGDLRLDLGLGEIRKAGVVLGCLDSVNARWALNRKCLQAGVEWIDAGISDFHGQVTRYGPHAGACFECTFTRATYDRFDKRYACPYGLRTRQPENKVPTTAVTASLTAAIQVQQALLLLHGQEGGLAPGQRLSVFLQPFHMTVDALPPDPACLAHDPIPQCLPSVAISVTEHSAGDVLRQAQAFLPGAHTLELPFDLVVAFECPGCGEREELLRPKEKVYQDETRCPQCGAMRGPFTQSSVSLEDPLAGRSLSDLGLPPNEILVIGHDSAKIFIELHQPGAVPLGSSYSRRGNHPA
jgi:adenylyltransferase/sulfurtransferase